MTYMTNLVEDMLDNQRKIIAIELDDPQPEGDFSGASEDEEWGGR